jgi:hypothetical protein
VKAKLGRSKSHEKIQRVKVRHEEIDRSGLALWKEEMEQVRARVESEAKRRMQSMSSTERTKFKTFLSNIRVFGDVGKAAGKSRVSRRLLDKWMNTPGVSHLIDEAVNAARILGHGGTDAKSVLFRAKIAPELEKDAEVFRVTGQRDRESRIIAKYAAKNLKAHRWHIAQAANNNDRGFFIDLGRILSGEVTGALYDKIDETLAEIWEKHPEYNTRQIAAELGRQGIELEENTIRTRKSRLGLTRSKSCKL